jgi:hypothetical protein
MGEHRKSTFIEPANNTTGPRSCASTALGTVRGLPRSIIMSEEELESETNFVLLKDPGFWVAQLLACGLIVISGIVIWYVQS